MTHTPRTAHASDMAVLSVSFVMSGMTVEFLASEDAEPSWGVAIATGRP
jgi:hypothetical protein